MRWKFGIQTNHIGGKHVIIAVRDIVKNAVHMHKTTVSIPGLWHGKNFPESYT